MNKSNLLMVDDSPYMHKMVRAFLEPDPFVLYSAFDGPAGVKQAGKLKPSLILMDIDMPQMDGFEACRQLQATPGGANIPIIFLTADCSMSDKVKALDMGAVDYITKPFKPEELRARVRSALRMRKRLEKTELVDVASGLWNQAYLDLQIPVLLSLSRRSGQALSCFVMEIDNFEKLDAKYGGDFEEMAVKGVAGVLLDETRTEDLLCHCGGGRFVSLIPATGREGASLLAERVRGRIEEHLLNLEARSLNITCSIGVSDSLLAGHLSLLDAADNALVRSKARKGNRVSIAEPDGDALFFAA